MYSIDNLKKAMQFILLAALSIWVASMMGCSTAKKDFKNVNTAILRSPAQTAKQLDGWRPCIPIGTVKTDSIAFKKKINEMQNTISYWKNKPARVIYDTVGVTDSVKADFYKSKWKECEAAGKEADAYIADLSNQLDNIPAIHDTLPPVRDTRIEEMLKGQISEGEARYNIEFNGRQKAQAGADKKQILINWLIVVCAVFGGYTGFSLYKKFMV